MDRVVAVVNGRVILDSELKEKSVQFTKEMERQRNAAALEPRDTLPRRILDQLINEILLQAEIDRRGFAATPTVIDGAVTTVMKQNQIDSMEEFRKILRDEGMSLDEYRRSLKAQIENSRLMNEVIRPRVQIGDRDVEAAYQRRIADEGKDYRYRIRMIFRKKQGSSRKAVEALRKEILAGTPFEKVADRETEGAGKGEGGLVGEVALSDLQPELSAALERLSTGRISEVIETAGGFYLLQNLEKTAAERSPPPAERDRIREELTREETARQFDALVRGLREKAQIEVLL